MSVEEEEGSGVEPEPAEPAEPVPFAAAFAMLEQCKAMKKQRLSRMEMPDSCLDSLVRNIMTSHCLGYRWAFALCLR